MVYVDWSSLQHVAKGVVVVGQKSNRGQDKMAILVEPPGTSQEFWCVR